MALPISYQDPIDQGPLILEAAGYRNPRSGFLYPVHDEIPVFLTTGAVEGPNARYQMLYDRIAPAYDVSTRLYARWKSGAEATRRKAYLELLEVRAGASLLEVSAGTGANWAHLDRSLDFYGLDLSARMLARCRRHARERKLRFQLCQGVAEHLPFPNSAFDAVLHVGGINFFTDPAAALREMIRVARPGTRLVVVDETEEFAQRHESAFIGRAFYGDRPRTIKPPLDLLPPQMEEVQLDTVWAGDLYVLSFRKPRTREGLETG